MTRTGLAALSLSLIACGLLVLALGTRGAAASSCSSRLLDDWRDGRIDGTYAIHCYREALESLPEDLRVYSTVEDDISRALQTRLAEKSTRSERVAVHPGVTESSAAGSASGTGRGRTAGPPVLEVLGAIGVLLVAAGSIGAFVRDQRAARRARS